MHRLLIAVLAGAPLLAGGTAVRAAEIPLRISLGHTASKAAPFSVRLITSGGVEVRGAGGAWSSTAGAGKTDSRTFTVAYPEREITPIQNLHVIWADLIAHSDADTVRRLTEDAAMRPDARKLTVQLDDSGTRGFSVTIDQLLRTKAFWIPSLDIFLTTGDAPVSFADHQRELERYHGRRILDQVAREPEATYEQYRNMWQDMGSPNYIHPAQTPPGHIIGLTWDSAIAKFGIDRGAGIWNDNGNPDHFRLRFGFANLTEGIGPYWKGQRLADGLPFVTTTLERDGVRYEVEEFTYPLNGPPTKRTGEVAMLLLARVKVTDLENRVRTVPVSLAHERRFPSDTDSNIVSEQSGGKLVLLARGRRNAILAIDAAGAPVVWNGVQEEGQTMKRVDVTVSLNLPAGGSREFSLALPSPMAAPTERAALLAVDHDAARDRAMKFWSDYVAHGAQFNVPDKAVNDLFRASLWHALRLPRRHADGTIDLPYTNFAYDQTGTPWPVNQAVYVDYMLYGLRGYDRIAAEELDAIYRNNQEFSGHVNGFAHWHCYTPGMLYAVARNYLLSGDRETFDRVLPATLKALDWTLAQVRNSNGLVEGPLNDLTGNGYWSFNQAYFYAGLDMMGKALARAGHPRAQECSDAARSFRSTIERGFRKASVLSPLVELRDHTWIPYVPCEPTKYGRLYEQWYPTDVDTGAAHLLRLQALDADSDLADSLLNDHEDNLFLHGWGMANEPVYNQQATAYLLRDDAKAAIRAFYSYMACAFSHGAFESVEHRWRWGQFYGPPSTDGAWFELYRNMLVRELDDNTLLLGQAAPRAWLSEGKKIEVKNAPTWFGSVSYQVENRGGAITASVRLDARKAPQSILVRLRHPQEKRIRQVTVNGKEWKDFDPAKEWVKVPGSGAASYTIVATY